MRTEKKHMVMLMAKCLPQPWMQKMIRRGWKQMIGHDKPQPHYSLSCTQDVTYPSVKVCQVWQSQSQALIAGKQEIWRVNCRLRGKQYFTKITIVFLPFHRVQWWSGRRTSWTQTQNDGILKEWNKKQQVVSPPTRYSHAAQASFEQDKKKMAARVWQLRCARLLLPWPTDHVSFTAQNFSNNMMLDSSS